MHRPFILVVPDSHSTFSAVSAAIPDIEGILADIVKQH